MHLVSKILHTSPKGSGANKVSRPTHCIRFRHQLDLERVVLSSVTFYSGRYLC